MPPRPPTRHLPSRQPSSQATQATQATQSSPQSEPGSSSFASDPKPYIPSLAEPAPSHLLCTEHVVCRCPATRTSPQPAIKQALASHPPRIGIAPPSPPLLESGALWWCSTLRAGFLSVLFVADHFPLVGLGQLSRLTSSFTRPNHVRRSASASLWSHKTFGSCSLVSGVDSSLSNMATLLCHARLRFLVDITPGSCHPRPLIARGLALGSGLDQT